MMKIKCLKLLCKLLNERFEEFDFFVRDNLIIYSDDGCPFYIACAHNQLDYITIFASAMTSESQKGLYDLFKFLPTKKGINDNLVLNYNEKEIKELFNLGK